MKMKKKFISTILAVCTMAIAFSSAGCGASRRVEQYFCEHEYVVHSIKREATCTEKGEAVIRCKSCKHERSVSISVKPHNYDEGTVTIAVRCKTAGEMVYQCQDCSMKKVKAIPALGHDESFEKYGFCNRCGEDDGSWTDFY